MYLYRYLLILFICLWFKSAIAGPIDPLLPDYRIVIDNSQANTQDKIEAAWRLLPFKLPAGAIAGAILYSDTLATVIEPGVINASWREKASLRAIPKSSPLQVNLNDVLRYAARDWVEKDRMYNRNILLFTAGEISPSSVARINKEVMAELLDTTIPFLKEKGVVVNVVSLSEDYDSELAKVASYTGGKYFIAGSIRNILGAINNVFDNIGAAEIEEDNNTFSIGKNIKTVTLVIKKSNARSNIKIQSPLGKIYQADQYDAKIKWFENGNTDYVTISDPRSGKWSIIGNLNKDKEFKVYNNINIKLHNDFGKYFLGEDIPVQIGLHSDDALIKDNDLFNTINIDFMIFNDEELVESYDLTDNLLRDNNGDVLGVFSVDLDSTSIANLKGKNTFEAKLSGRTIKSELKGDLPVSLPPFIVEQDTEVKANGVKKLSFDINLVSQEIDADSVKIEVRAKDDAGRDFPVSVGLIGIAKWSFYLLPSDKINFYGIEIDATGKTVNGRNFRLNIANLNVPVPNIELPEPEIIYQEVVVNNGAPEVITVEKEKKLKGLEVAIGILLLILMNIMILVIWFVSVFLLKSTNTKTLGELEKSYQKSMGGS